MERTFFSGPLGYSRWVRLAPTDVGGYRFLKMAWRRACLSLRFA